MIIKPKAIIAYDAKGGRRAGSAQAHALALENILVGMLGGEYLDDGSIHIPDERLEPRKGSFLLWQLRAANFAITTDQRFSRAPGIPSPVSRYRFNLAVAVWRSGSPGISPLGGIYSGASKSGNAWVAASQSWANLTAAHKTVTATNATVTNTDSADAESPPYFSLSTASSTALTGDIFIFALPLDLIPAEVLE